MSQVIVWHNGRYYERVDRPENGEFRVCRGCVARDDKYLCDAITGGSDTPICTESMYGMYYGSPSYVFKQVEVSDDKYRK